MRKSAQLAPWAVYQMAVQGRPGPNVVCSQSEWDAVEKAAPGLHRLIKGGIVNEGEAERLARGTSGDDPVRIPRKKLPAGLLDAEPDLAVEAGAEPGVEEGQDDAVPLLLPFPALTKGPSGLGEADGPPAQVGGRADGEVE